MAPNLETPTGTLDPKSDKISQLEYIEQRLQQIETDTLRIQRKNKQIIKTIEKSTTGINKEAHNTNLVPQKPPRKNKHYADLSSFIFPEVEKALNESDRVKSEMQRTLRDCKTQQEVWRATMDRNFPTTKLTSGNGHGKFHPTLEKDNVEDNGGGPFNVDSKPTIPLPVTAPVSFLSRIRDVIGKLSYTQTEKFAQKPTGQQTASQLNNHTSSSSRPVISNPKEISNVTSQTASCLKNDDLILHSTLKPVPKPRVSKAKPPGKPWSISSISSGQSDAPFIRIQTKPKPKTRVPKFAYPADAMPLTFEELRKLNQTEEDSSTLPHQNPDIYSVPLTPNECNVADDTCSDFEDYISAPLKIQNATASEDSNESTLIHNMMNDAKRNEILARQDNDPFYSSKRTNKKPSECRKAYKKARGNHKLDTEIEKELQASSPGSTPYPHRRLRPSSPPPPLPPKLGQKIKASVSVTNFKAVQAEDNREVKSPEPSTELQLQNKTSALCSGVPVTAVSIPLKPWSSCGYEISLTSLNDGSFNSASQTATQPYFDEIQPNQQTIEFETNDLNTKTSLNLTLNEEDLQSSLIEESISQNFAFLDYFINITPEVGKFPEVQECFKILEKQGIPVISDVEDQSTEIQNFSALWNQLIDWIEIVTEVCCDTRQESFPPSPATTEAEIVIAVTELPETAPIDALSQLALSNDSESTENSTVASSFNASNERSEMPASAPLATKLTPPPPPPMFPDYSSSSSKSAWRSLPVAPLDQSTLTRPTIFDTIRTKANNSDDSDFQIDIKLFEKNFMQPSEVIPKRQSFSGSSFPTDAADNTSRPKGLCYNSFLSNNVITAIAVGSRKLKSSMKTLTGALMSLNYKELSIDDIEILKQMIPKNNTETTLETLRGKDDEGLCKESKVLKSLSEIPRVAKKLDILGHMTSFEGMIKNLDAEIETLEEAINSIENSEKFSKVFEVVLKVMNTAFVKGSEPMTGFEIQSLARLSYRKSSDGKMTLLNCIIKCMEASDPESTHFFEDFKCIEEVLKLSTKDILQVMTELEQGYQALSDEINLIKQDANMADTNLADAFLMESKPKQDRIQSRWTEVINHSKNVMEYYGVSNTTMDFKEFLHIISEFVQDYIKGLEQNRLLFRQVDEEARIMEDLRNKNKRLSLYNPKDLQKVDSSGVDKAFMSILNRKQSLGNVQSTLQQLQQPDNQNAEFIEAVVFMSQADKDKQRRRKSLSVLCPKPYSRMARSTSNLTGHNFIREMEK